MQFAARYQDGIVAEVRKAECVLDLAADPVALVILDGASREVLDRWDAASTYLLHSRMAELRIGSRKKPAGARLGVTGVSDTRAALGLLPMLHDDQRRDLWTQLRILVLATAALAAVIVTYLYGIPLLADRLVGFVPPAWESKIGDTAAGQIERQLTNGRGYVVCDPDRNSTANVAIASFVARAFDGLDTPFHPTVIVVRSTIPNAFALPGGRTYYLSSLIEASRTPDEFAGVLAHELGHVYYRHGMQSLIASSATGLLVGFIVGDMTGLSVAGAVGSRLIDNRFSRQDESLADRFAAETARRLGFSPKGLGDLLDRVAHDDEFSRALALFSNHPLTEQRRAALAALSTPVADAKPAFTDAEWQAIRNMCPLPAPPPLPPLTGAP